MTITRLYIDVFTYKLKLCLDWDYNPSFTLIYVHLTHNGDVLSKKKYRLSHSGNFESCYLCIRQKTLLHLFRKEAEVTGSGEMYTVVGFKTSRYSPLLVTVNTNWLRGTRHATPRHGQIKDA